MRHLFRWWLRIHVCVLPVEPHDTRSQDLGAPSSDYDLRGGPLLGGRLYRRYLSTESRLFAQSGRQAAASECLLLTQTGEVCSGSLLYRSEVLIAKWGRARALDANKRLAGSRVGALQPLLLPSNALFRSEAYKKVKRNRSEAIPPRGQTRADGSVKIVRLSHVEPPRCSRPYCCAAIISHFEPPM